MPKRDPNLHGNIPDDSKAALLLVDVVNDLEFEDGEKLLAGANAIADNLVCLKRRAHEAGIPVIYVNDNFGRWTSDFRRLVEHCLTDDVRGRPLVRKLTPREDDYFVLKAKNSGFFGTTLDLVLKYLGTTSLILTGFTSDVCVLFTANDAYMREYRLWVPSDCTTSMDLSDHERALKYMERVLGADIRESSQLDLSAIATHR